MNADKLKSKANYLAKCMRYVELCSRWVNISLSNFPNFSEAEKDIQRNYKASNRQNSLPNLPQVHNSASTVGEQLRAKQTSERM